MNLAILDDNKDNAYTIKELLNTYQFDIDMYLTNFTDVLNKKYDLIIMDIELIELSGIDLANQIQTKYPYTMIIYVTNYHQYVSDVYATNHLFYIEKDHLEKYLPLAISKAIDNYKEIKDNDLVISWRKSKEFISLKDIIYLERSDRRTEIYTSRTTYLSLEKLDDLLPRLNGQFLRCHKSFIVNMKYIYKLDKSHIILNDNTVIPISRSLKNDVISKYHSYLIKA